jgi:hypothetical protein
MQKDLWMELEAAEEEAFFINILVGDEEEIIELESVEREEEEEFARLERGLDNHVKERKIARERDTKKDERDRIRKQLGDTPRVRRREEIMEMDVDKMEEEIKKTEEAIDDNHRTRAEWARIAAAAGQDPREESEADGEQVAMAIDAPGGRWTECGSVKAFPTYDCSKEHHSGIVFTA